MSTKRKVILAAVAVALLPVTVHAQEDRKGPATVRTEQEMKQDAATEKAYLDTLKRERSLHQPGKSDPWAAVRPAAGTGSAR